MSPISWYSFNQNAAAFVPISWLDGGTVRCDCQKKTSAARFGDTQKRLGLGY